MPLSETPIREKRELRSHAVTRRAALDAALRAHAADAIARHFLTELAQNSITIPSDAVVSGYWPLPEELDPRPLMTALAARGHDLALPVVTARGAPLAFRRWSAGEPLLASVLGTVVPAETAPLVEPDVLLVPLLAFDKTGYRLGYGGGYYDRTLAALRRRAVPTLAIGLAFAAQEVEAVPHGEHDERLDWIVTEHGARRCQ